MVMLARVLLLTALALGLAGSSGAATSAGRPATGEELVLMMEAIEKTARELPRWAYTETRVMRDDKGKVKRNEVVRYDPSLPYDQQWQPISINGKQPSAREREKYRRQGMRMQERDEKAEKKETVGGTAEITLDRGAMRRPVTLGEVLLTHAAKVVSADAKHIVFDIPLRKDRNERFPPEKFQVLARVAKETRALEKIDVNLRESFRTKVVVKVKAGDGTMSFSQVDPKHAPTLTHIRGDATASIFFVSIGGEFELTRTELKPVKPYNERFEVQIGTIQAIDF
jgi:hypothetical protein